MDKLMNHFTQINWDNAFTALLRIVLILVLVRIAIAILKAGLRRFARHLAARGAKDGEADVESAKRAETLVKLLRQGALLLLWLAAGLMILRELGIDVGPILASAGIAGVALGFGAQYLVRDVISGFFIILENQVRVGDVAVINGTGGLVEQVNFRTLVLRDLSGVMHFFPNGSINSLSNVTQEWSAYVFDIGVDYLCDTDEVVAVMRRVGAELRADPRFGQLMLDDVEVFGVDTFADSAVIIKGRIRTLPIKQWDVGREYLRRLKKAFDSQGISIPFPKRTLHIAETAKPLDVRFAEAAGK